MDLVGSAFHYGIEDAAGATAKLRTELVLQNGNLRNRVIGDENERTGVVPAVVADTVKIERIIVGPLSGDAGTGSLANSTRGGNAR